MDEIERKHKIYLELVEEARSREPKKQDGEFSINDFASSSDLGKDYARKLLEEKVAAGILSKRKTSRGAFYSPI